MLPVCGRSRPVGTLAAEGQGQVESCGFQTVGRPRMGAAARVCGFWVPPLTLPRLLSLPWHGTMTTGDTGQQQAAAWRLPGPQGLGSLKASLASSSAQTSIVPPAALTRVSSQLSEQAEVVKRNSQLLLTSATQKAQTALKEAGLSDDWALLKRVGTTDRRVAAGPTMRRVASDTNFQRSHGRLMLQPPPAAGTMVPAGSPTAQQQLNGEQQRAADAWNWLSALNNSLSQARAGQQSKFALSRAGLEEQVCDGRVVWQCSSKGWQWASWPPAKGVLMLCGGQPRPLSFRVPAAGPLACVFGCSS